MTILVPTYNEPELGPWLDRLRDNVDDAEILLVDDSRPDVREALRQTAAARGASVVDGPANGKGAAIRDGIRAAHGEIVVMIDADSDEATLRRIPEFIAKIREGNDVVIAERQGRHEQLRRVILSTTFRLVQRLLIFHSMRFRDTQCGFKAFRREAALRLAEKQTVFAGLFDVEYLYIAVCNKMRIAQIPLEMWPESRPSHLNLLRFLRTGPLDLLRVKANGLRGRYSR